MSQLRISTTPKLHQNYTKEKRSFLNDLYITTSTTSTTPILKK